MANTVLHKSETRGHANHGWLDAHHTFSFANYYDLSRVHFGMLRVLNDDVIEGGKGFGMHPHDNMEIITIPIEGALEHKDSMGNTGVIQQHDVQVMSAGSGVRHSEYNKNNDKPINLLQIWIFPNKSNVEPRYDQLTYNPNDRKNKLQQIIAPGPSEKKLWIHQDAWLHMGKFDKDFSTEYNVKKKENGVYVFVVFGSVFINGQLLNKRDGMGLWDIDKLTIKADTECEVLLIEVPMY